MSVLVSLAPFPRHSVSLAPPVPSRRPNPLVRAPLSCTPSTLGSSSRLSTDTWAVLPFGRCARGRAHPCWDGPEVDRPVGPRGDCAVCRTAPLFRSSCAISHLFSSLFPEIQDSGTGCALFERLLHGFC